MNLAHLVYRIVTEPRFASLFRTDPKSILRNTDFTLEPDAIQALAKILESPSLVIALLSDTGSGPNGPVDWAVKAMPFESSSVRRA